MLISDWSSDVCSSDLRSEGPCHHVLSLKFRSSVVSTSLSPMTSRSLAHARRLLRLINFDVLTIEPQIHAVANIGESLRGRRQSKRRAGRPLDRKSVGEGKSVSVRVDSGGWRDHK